MRNNKGSSIVSVMVAFLILLMGIAMLFTAIRASQKVSDGAEKLVEQSDRAVNEYYLNPEVLSGGGTLCLRGEETIPIQGDVKKKSVEGFDLYYMNHE